jgi:hypothetical protein
LYSVNPLSAIKWLSASESRFLAKGVVALTGEYREYENPCHRGKAVASSDFDDFPAFIYGSLNSQSMAF